MVYKETYEGTCTKGGSKRLPVEINQVDDSSTPLQARRVDVPRLANTVGVRA